VKKILLIDDNKDFRSEICQSLINMNFHVKVIVIDHQDCGAYAAMIDPNLTHIPHLQLSHRKGTDTFST